MRQAGLAAPLGVSQKNKFRDKFPNRCKIPVDVIGAFRDVDGALTAMTTFLTTLTTQEDAMFGAEGANAGYARVMKALATAFDWAYHTKHKPTNHHHLQEFGVACKMLLPYVRRTEWPPAADWPEVPHAWPEDMQEVKAQYLLLMHRVLKARLRQG